MSLKPHFFSGQDSHANGSQHTVVRRNNDPLLQQHGERGCNRIIVCRAPLEVDHATDLPATDDTVEIVQRDRIRQTGNNIRFLGPLVNVRVDVTFDEDRASLTELNGCSRRKGQRREFLHDADPKALSLLLEK